MVKKTCECVANKEEIKDTGGNGIAWLVTKCFALINCWFCCKSLQQPLLGNLLILARVKLAGNFSAGAGG